MNEVRWAWERGLRSGAGNGKGGEKGFPNGLLCRDRSLCRKKKPKFQEVRVARQDGAATGGGFLALRKTDTKIKQQRSSGKNHGGLGHIIVKRKGDFSPRRGNYLSLRLGNKSGKELHDSWKIFLKNVRRRGKGLRLEGSPEPEEKELSFIVEARTLVIRSRRQEWSTVLSCP